MLDRYPLKSYFDSRYGIGEYGHIGDLEDYGEKRHGGRKEKSGTLTKFPLL